MIFAAFYADVPGKPSRAAEFARYARIGAACLAATTPDSRYLLLTDKATAPAFQNSVETAVVAPDDAPLMLKVMLAQRAFLASPRRSYTVLADVDAVANRDLTHATPNDVGFATTTKSAKFNYRINNLAYVRDFDLGVWFLDRAISILRTWPADKLHWDGDQEAWEAALGNYPRASPQRLYLANAPGPINLYPCDTHNCPAHRHGAIKQTQRDAYVLHFKGPRKRLLADFARSRLNSDVAAAVIA